MLKTKNKVEFETKTKSLNKNIKRKSILKSIAMGFAMIVGSIAAYDVAITATNIKHTTFIVDYKVANDAKLNDYSTFKKMISSVPYSDADFKRDLLTFEYIYGYKGGDNPAFQKAFMFDKGVGVSLNRIMSVNMKIDNPIAYYSELEMLTRNHSEKEVFDVNKYPDFNKKIQEVYKKNTNYTADLNDVRLMKSVYSNFILNDTFYYESNKKMYDNLKQLLIENGFNGQTFFIDKSYIKNIKDVKKKTNYDYNSPELKKVYKENNEVVDLINQRVKTYYENGDYDKLKELFKIGNAFAHIAIVDPVNKMAGNYVLGTPIYMTIDYMMNKNDVDEEDNPIINQAKFYEKYFGNLTPEKEKYYKEGYDYILFM
ncbi:hypothetical protein ACTOJ1_001002 [Shigella flexneri]